MYNNPFQNVPSASKLHRVLECPASHQAELAAPEVKEDTTDSDTGNEVHAILSGELHEDSASMEAVQTAERCNDQANRLLAEWQNAESVPLGFRELRYGLTRLGGVVRVDESTRAEIVFTGQFDLLYTQGNRGLLIDFKSLRGDHASAIENPQLMSLAVLVAKKHKLETVRVALVQPLKGNPTTADLSTHGLQLAESWLVAALDAERNAGPDDLRAGKHCQYCKARFRCRVFAAAAIQEVEVIEPATIAGLDGETQRKAMWARALDLPATRLAAAMNGLAMVKRYVATIEGVAKARAGDDPEFQRFFTLKTSPGNREINDAQKAFAALEPLGVTAEAALAACSMSFGPLEEAVRKASGIKIKTEKRTVYNITADQAKKALNVALESAGAISRKADKSELVPVAITDS
jgi:hypothetical protein